MFLWTMVWCIIFAPGGFSMLISKLSHARPAERFLFLMIWLGTRVLVLRSVSSIQRSICLIVLSLAQWPKRFSKKTIVLLPVKDFMVKPSDIHFPGINFRPEQAKRASAELPSVVYDFFVEYCTLPLPVKNLMGIF